MSENSKTCRSGRGAGALLVILVFVVLALLAAPYEAAALEAAGLPAPAEKLYAFTVRTLDHVTGSLAPEWAYINLARLRPAPERIVQIAQLASDKHSETSATLYELAIPTASPDQRLDWLEAYADALAPTDGYEAARVRFAVAGLTAGSANRERSVRNFEASLALVDDPNVRWQEARFLLHAQDARAADVLREIIKRNQTDIAANYALGLLQWRQGDMDGARVSLLQAARDQRYNPTLQTYLSTRDAATRLQNLVDDDNSQNTAAQSEHEQAKAQHTALYERMRQFDCDPRQISDWEKQSDYNIEGKCKNIQISLLVQRLAEFGMGIVIPEFFLGRLGAAAEMGVAEAGALETGALEARGLSAESIAAVRASSTLEERFAIDVTDSLRSGGADSVERSIAERKIGHWEVYGPRYTAKLEAEQNWVMKDIEIVFEVRQEKVARYFKPREAEAKSTQTAGENERDHEIAMVVESRPVFKVKLGKIHLDGLPSDCSKDHQSTETANCPSG